MDFHGTFMFQNPNEVCLCLLNQKMKTNERERESEGRGKEMVAYQVGEEE